MKSRTQKTKSATVGTESLVPATVVPSASPKAADDIASRVKMLFHDWGIPLLVLMGGGALASGTYVAKELHDLSLKVVDGTARSDERHKELSSRVERIANVLPDIKVRLAKEELAKPIPIAIMVSDPIRLSKGNIVKKVAIVDSAKNQAVTYTVPSTAESSENVDLMIAGVARKLDAQAITFSELDAFAIDVNDKIRSPQELSPRNSYVLRTTNLTNGQTASSMLARALSASKTVSTTHFVKGMNNYADVVSRLQLDGDLRKAIEIPAIYEVVQPQSSQAYAPTRPQNFNGYGPNKSTWPAPSTPTRPQLYSGHGSVLNAPDQPKK